MKIISLFFAAMVVSLAFALSSCGKSSSDASGNGDQVETADDSPAMKAMKAQVEQLKSTLPVDMQGGLKMTDVELSDGYLTFTCQYPADIEFEVPQDDSVKKSIVGGLPRPTLRVLKNLDLGIKYIYVQEGEGGKEQTLSVTPEEISSYLN